MKGRRGLIDLLYDIEGGSHSKLELLYLRALRTRGVEMPKRNYEIRIDGKRLFLDTAWPDKRVYAEIDGKSFHFMAEDWENDLSRQNALSGLLWLPLRYSGRALRRDAPACADHTARVLAAIEASPRLR